MDIDRTTATGLFLYAHSYAASAIALTQHSVRAVHPDAPIRYLFSHAAELYLKSFCRLRGVTVRELSSRKLGHDLLALLDRAVELGFDRDADLYAHLEYLNDAIFDRYILTGRRTVLEASAMQDVCARLNDRIGPAIFKAEGLTRAVPSLEVKAILGGSGQPT